MSARRISAAEERRRSAQAVSLYSAASTLELYGYPVALRRELEAAAEAIRNGLPLWPEAQP